VYLPVSDSVTVRRRLVGNDEWWLRWSLTLHGICASCPVLRAVTVSSSLWWVYTRLTVLFPGEPVPEREKPIWILLKQETVSGSDISWAICKHAACTSLQTDNHASTPPLSFYRPDALPAAQPTASKHWRYKVMKCSEIHFFSYCYCNALLSLSVAIRQSIGFHRHGCFKRFKDQKAYSLSQNT